METKKTRHNLRFIKSVLTKPLTLIWGLGLVALVVGSLIPHAYFSQGDSTFGKDKLIRILIFTLLTFYPTAFFSSINRGLVIATSIAPLGFVLEIIQKYIPGRHFSALDMIANNSGAIVGILLALMIRFFFYTGGKNKIGGAS